MIGVGPTKTQPDFFNNPSVPPSHPPKCGSACGLGKAQNQVDQGSQDLGKSRQGWRGGGGRGRARDGREEEGEKEEVDRVGEKERNAKRGEGGLIKQGHDREGQGEDTHCLLLYGPH